jgi:putative DNA primase/helicase
MAEECRLAVIGITHYTKGTQGKNPVERITGSLAFGALPRVLWGAALDEDGNNGRFVRTGSNIGPRGGGFEYQLERVVLNGTAIEAQRVAWGKYRMGSARALLDEVASDEMKTTAVSNAGVWLRGTLWPANQQGMTIPEVKAAAAAHGYMWRAVERAKHADPTIEVFRRPGAAETGWCWRVEVGEEVNEKMAPPR